MYNCLNFGPALFWNRVKTSYRFRRKFTLKCATFIQVKGTLYTKNNLNLPKIAQYIYIFFVMQKLGNMGVNQKLQMLGKLLEACFQAVLRLNTHKSSTGIL